MKVKRGISLFTTVIMLICLMPAAIQAEARTARFGAGSWEKAEASIITAKYNETTYVMGAAAEKGRAAISVTNLLPNGSYDLSSDDVTFFEVEYENEEYTVQYAGYKSYFTPFYLKSDDGYLTFDEEKKLTVVEGKEALKWWTDSWASSFGRHSYVIVNQVDSSAANAKIVLKVDDGAPYFTIAESVDENNIATAVVKESCMHKNMVHHEKINATCHTDGKKEYWYCADCNRNYADEHGYTYASEDLTLHAYSAIDIDGDGYCDDCGKSMPIYKKVTAATDIVAGGKYLLVAEIDDKKYALKNLTQEYIEEQYKNENYEIDVIGATEIQLENDAVKFMTAKNDNAMMFAFRFAAEGLDWSAGIRYGMHYSYDESGDYLLSSYGGNFNAESALWAKYGFRPAMNENGSVKISSSYDEWWDADNQTEENGIYFRAFKMTQDGDSTIFFGMKPAANYKTEENEITTYPVYLYRLFESGTVNETDYIIADEPSDRDFTVVTNSGETISTDALTATNVSGVSEALTQEAVNGYVRQFDNMGNALTLNVAAEVTVDEYTKDEAITFSVNPYIYDTAAPDNHINIEDSSFRGSPMTVTLYTCGIRPVQVIHEKQDGTKEYFYGEYSEQAESGSKTFTFEQDMDGNGYITLEITEFSDIKLLTTAETPSYTVTFDTDGGSAVEQQTISEGGKATEPTEQPTKNGYTFSKWQLDGADYDFNTEVNANITLKAVWTPIEYNIITQAQNGIITVSENQVTAHIGEEISFTVSPNSGYTLKENSVKVNNGVVDVIQTLTGYKFTMPASAVTISAEFEEEAPDTVTVTFNAGEGTFANAEKTKVVTINKGATLASDDLPAVTPPTGYDFNGWGEITGKAINEPVTYTATYTIKSFTITWDIDGEKTSEELEYGAIPSYDGAPIKAEDASGKYSFTGWSPAIEAVTKAQTYTAQFDLIAKYTITYNTYEGAINESDYATVYYAGEGATLPTDVTKDDYTFAGWYDNVDFEGEPVTTIAKTQTGAKTYYAKWTLDAPTEYLITFVNWDNTELQKSNIAVGATPEYAGTTPAKAGDDRYIYEFIGWTPEITSVSGIATYKAVYRQYVKSVNESVKIEKITDNNNVNFVVTTTLSDLNVINLYSATYNRDGSLKKVEMTPCSKNADGVIIVPINEPTLDSGESYKLMLWDISQSPLIKAISSNDTFFNTVE